MRKQKTKSKFLYQRVTEFLEKNPKPSVKYVADKFGTSLQYVYSLKKKLALDKALTMSKPSSMFLVKSSFVKEVKDNVNSPTHYTTGGIETIDFIEAKTLNYNLGNVVKYVSRSEYKGKRLEDLKKARWYLCREINNLSK
jgi:hypothetical protein